MVERLPPQPHLRNLKNRAKGLLKAHRTGCGEAAAEIRGQLERFSRASAAEVLAADFTLLDAQLVIARRYGFSDWSALKRHIEGLRSGE